MRVLVYWVVVITLAGGVLHGVEGLGIPNPWRTLIALPPYIGLVVAAVLYGVLSPEKENSQ